MPQQKSSRGSFIESNYGEILAYRGFDLNVKLTVSSSADHYSREFTLGDPTLLSQVDKALGILDMKIENMADGVFYDIRSAPSRAPGFIVDGWIVVHKYDRKLEYAIYKELGNVLRNNRGLLFNIHVIATKGRQLNEVVPSNFRRYIPWSDYVC